MKLIPTIGIEMHCQMKTKSKVFSKSKNEYSNQYNIHVAPLDMAFPGTLPVLNKECVRKAIMASLMLNCKIPEYLTFDRKNYYYPDLPKGFQITQYFHPIGTNGEIEVPFEDKTMKVKIHDIHLEEDSAQLDHIGSSSYINYNRSGIPLLELVTEPCFHSKEEVIAFLEYIKRMYQYADISDADATKGQIRCDVNISLSDSDKLGTKTEFKNVNSFSNIALVIDSEIKRQTELIESGKGYEIEQETRRWDEEKQITVRMRSKADAIDYKYFPEPNIPQIRLSEEWIEEIKKSIPILPLERFKKYTEELQISPVDANILIKEKETSDFFDECLKLGIDSKSAVNWINVNIISYLNKEYKKMNELFLTPQHLKFILDKLGDGTISSKQAKEILNEVIEKQIEPEKLISKKNAQISDETELTKIIDEIILNNPNQLESYKNGKTNLFEFFVGQVMKNTKGKANPVKTREILANKLNS